jgi:hypothetical protein
LEQGLAPGAPRSASCSPSAPGAMLVGGWSLFNQMTAGDFGLTTAAGANNVGRMNAPRRCVRLRSSRDILANANRHKLSEQLAQPGHRQAVVVVSFEFKATKPVEEVHQL